MKRPDLDTLACVHPECQRFRLTGQAHLTVRKVYGQDHLRLLRCRTCGAEFSERRGTALFHTKVAEERAASVVNVARREKKQKRCRVEESAEAGDMWAQTAIAADSKLMVSLVVGKRTQAQTRALVHDAKKCLRPGHLPALCTDA